MKKVRPLSYGFDAPGVMGSFLAVGFIAVAVGAGFASLTIGWGRFAGLSILALGIAPLLLGFVMVRYGLVGKLKMRDFMIDRIP